MKTIIAIDPGMNGGIALLDIARALLPSRDKYYDVDGDVIVMKMPDTITDLHNFFSGIVGNKIVYLEDVHTMPGQGIASSGKFMRGVGNLESTAVCHNCKLIYVRPQVWQKALGLLTKKGDSKTQHKNKIKAFAQQRYPNIKVTLATADALAILEYAKEKEKGESK